MNPYIVPCRDHLHLHLYPGQVKFSALISIVALYFADTRLLRVQKTVPDPQDLPPVPNTVNPTVQNVQEGGGGTTTNRGKIIFSPHVQLAISCAVIPPIIMVGVLLCIECIRWPALAGA